MNESKEFMSKNTRTNRDVYGDDAADPSSDISEIKEYVIKQVMDKRRSDERLAARVFGYVCLDAIAKAITDGAPFFDREGYWTFEGSVTALDAITTMLDDEITDLLEMYVNETTILQRRRDLGLLTGTCKNPETAA